MKTLIFTIICSALIEGTVLAKRNFFNGNLIDTTRQLKRNIITIEDNDQDLSLLLLSFDYSSNTSTFGTFSQFVRQPSYSPSMTFISKYGFDISLSGYWIENSDDSLTGTTSEYDFTAGYSIQIKKKLIIYPSYSHYFHSKESNTLKSAFNDNFNLGIYYQSGRFLSGLSANYLLGTDNTFYLSVQNSIILSKENFIFRNSIIDLQPTVDINFITRSYYETYFWESLSASSSLRDFFNDYPDIRRRFVILKNNNPDLTNMEILDIISTDYTEEKEKFALGNIGVYFPVSYMIGNFIIDLNVLAYIPVNQPDYFDGKVQVFFDLGISYIIGFK